jgi:hypothetical protein
MTEEEGNTTIQADMDLRKLGVLLEEALQSQHMTHRPVLTTKTYHAYRRFLKGDTDPKMSGGLQEVMILMQKQQGLMYQDLDQKMSDGHQSLLSDGRVHMYIRFTQMMDCTLWVILVSVCASASDETMHCSCLEQS